MKTTIECEEFYGLLINYRYAYRREMQSTYQAVVEYVDAKLNARAKIDSLMLEYCPSEMTQDQVTTWVEHQQKSDMGIKETVQTSHDVTEEKMPVRQEPVGRFCIDGFGIYVQVDPHHEYEFDTYTLYAAPPDYEALRLRITELANKGRSRKLSISDYLDAEYVQAYLEAHFESFDAVVTESIRLQSECESLRAEKQRRKAK